MIKVYSIEDKIINFIKKYSIYFFLFVSILFSIILRFSSLNFMSGDMGYYLKPWFLELKSNGGFFGLSSYSGDYNYPYITILSLLSYLPFDEMHIIKLFSIIFDYLLSFACAKFIYFLTKNKSLAILSFGVILFLPNLIFNSSLWGQCDSIYAFFAILALYYLLKKKYFISFIFLGLSFSFKLQFIFVLPIFICLYFTEHKFSFLNFFIIPIIDFIMCIPAIISGVSIKKCLFVYLNQTKTYKDSLVLNYPNLWNIVNPGTQASSIPYLYRVGEILALFICAFMLFYLILKKIKFNNQKILGLTIWFSVIMMFVLPGMHERYLFVGEILSVVYFLVYKKEAFLCFFINAVVLIVYSNFLFALNFKYMDILSIFYLIIIIIYTYDIIKLLNVRVGRTYEKRK